MTVLIYVDASKQVGDVDHIKVFADRGCRGNLVSGKRSRRASRSNMRFWNEPHRAAAAPSGRDRLTLCERPVQIAVGTQEAYSPAVWNFNN